MANILVLGGAGYVGCPLVTELVKAHRVKVIDWGAFKDGMDYVFTLPIELVQSDTRQLSYVDFAGYDVVVDLAAISNDPAGELDASLTWDVNCHARKRNSQIAYQAGVKRYILASSCSVYGRVLEGEMADETSTVNPQSTYAEAAIEAERGVLFQHPASIVLRQATLYGVSRRMRWDVVVNKWAKDLYQNTPLCVYGSNHWRPFLHVYDTVSVMLRLIEEPNGFVSGKTYNLVGENFRMEDLAAQLSLEFGGQHRLYDSSDDTRSYRVSGKKFQDALNWTPAWKVGDGVQQVHAALLAKTVDPDAPMTLDVYRKMRKEKRQEKLR